MAGSHDWDIEPFTLTIPPGAGPSDARIVIGPDVPPELVTYYLTAPFAPVTPEHVIAAIIFYDATGHYSYQAVVIDSSATPIFSVTYGAFGIGGAVVEEYARVYFNPGTGAAYGFGKYTYTSFDRILLERTVNTVVEALGTFVKGEAFTRFQLGIDGTLAWGPGTAAQDCTLARAAGAILNLTATAWNFGPTDIRADGISQGRGRRDYVSSTAASAAIGVEATVLTGNSINWIDGRCYSVTMHGFTLASVGNVCAYRIRKTNLAGATLQIIRQDQLLATGTVGVMEEASCQIKRASGAGNLAANIVLTLAASAGTCTMDANTTYPRWLEIRDIGTETDYPNAIAIT